MTCARNIISPKLVQGLHARGDMYCALVSCLVCSFWRAIYPPITANAMVCLNRCSLTVLDSGDETMEENLSLTEHSVVTTYDP